MHLMLVGCCWGQTRCTQAHLSHACCSCALNPMSISHPQSWVPFQHSSTLQRLDLPLSLTASHAGPVNRDGLLRSSLYPSR